MFLLYKPTGSLHVDLSGDAIHSQAQSRSSDPVTNFTLALTISMTKATSASVRGA